MGNFSDTENFKTIHQYCDNLKLDYPKLSDFELLSIAVQMQKNDILRAGLNVPQTDSYPSALEAIAIMLGMKREGARGNEPGTLIYELERIADNTEKED